MGCCETKEASDDTERAISLRPKSDFTKQRNGSLRSKHDICVQVGTPYSSKKSRNVSNGAVSTEADYNENVMPVTSLSPTDDLVNDSSQAVVVENHQEEQQTRTYRTDGQQQDEKVKCTIVNVECTNEKASSPIIIQHKWLVQDSWKYVERDLLEFGMVFFARLLEQNPGLNNLWSFGKMNYATEVELRSDVAFQDHSRRVMEMIGSAVNGLDDLELLVPSLIDLGQRHRMYGAKPEHFKAVGEALIYSYHKGLDERIWTDEVNQAWVCVFQVIADVMSAQLVEDQ